MLVQVRYVPRLGGTASCCGRHCSRRWTCDVQPQRVPWSKLTVCGHPSGDGFPEPETGSYAQPCLFSAMTVRVVCPGSHLFQHIFNVSSFSKKRSSSALVASCFKCISFTEQIHAFPHVPEVERVQPTDLHLDKKNEIMCECLQVYIC